VLTVDGLIAGYQHGSRVLDGVLFHVQRGEIVALMGRCSGKINGAACTTGHLPASRNDRADGEDLGRASHEIANLVGYVPGPRDLRRLRQKRTCSWG
jgi:ABC-type multidrug transport system ATPase subunit